MALVQGIGDEVFAVLFLLGLVMVVVYNVLRPRRTGAVIERPTNESNTGAEPFQPAPQQPHEESLSDSRSGEPDSRHPEGTQVDRAALRRRLNVSSAEERPTTTPQVGSIWEAATGSSRSGGGPAVATARPKTATSEPRHSATAMANDREGPPVPPTLPPDYAADLGRTAGAVHREESPQPREEEEEEAGEGIVRLWLQCQESRREVSCPVESTFRQLAAQHFPEAVAEGRRVTFIRLGQVVSLERTVQSAGIAADGEVVHVVVGTQPTASDQQDRGEAVLDISGMFPVLLGLMLLIVWSILIAEPRLFATSAKLMLYGVSFGFLLLLYGQILRRHIA